MGDWARCCPVAGSGARAGAEAGMPSRVVVPEVCSLSVPSWCTFGFASLPRCSGLSFAIALGGGCGTQSLTWSTLRAACLPLVAEDRQKLAEIPVCCPPAHLWLCSIAGEVLAVLHTGATWTALPSTGWRTWVSYSGAAQASASGLGILSATSSPSVTQGKA